MQARRRADSEWVAPGNVRRASRKLRGPPFAESAPSRSRLGSEPCAAGPMAGLWLWPIIRCAVFRCSRLAITDVPLLAPEEHRAVPILQLDRCSTSAPRAYHLRFDAPRSLS